MKVLVVIVSHNFMPWIDRCLGSLRLSTLPLDVIVIDNASEDDTVSHIESHYPEVKIVRNRDNMGFGKANNIGFKVAIEQQYDAVYLLNQDAWLHPDTMEKLCEASKKHPDYGILSPVHLTATEQSLDKGFADYTKKCSFADIKALQAEGKDVVETPFINAAHWLIPISALRCVGGFSPLFWLYGEDVDMVNRFHYHGFRLGYVPRAVAIHDRSDRKESPQSKQRARYVYLLSQYSNPNKSLPSAFAYSVIASLKSMTGGILHLSWQDTSQFARIFVRLVQQTKAVLRARRIVVEKGTHFL